MLAMCTLANQGYSNQSGTALKTDWPKTTSLSLTQEEEPLVTNVFSKFSPQLICLKGQI